MNHSIAKIFITAAALNTTAYAELQSEPKDVWQCDGYCYYGGDAPTSPFVPVGSQGATEQEARDNIDCNGFEEVDITCRKISDGDAPVGFID